MPQSHAFLAPGVGPVTAVPAWRVPAEQRARAMERHAARAVVTALGSDASQALFALCALATGVERSPIRRLEATVIVQAIDAALASGSLLLFTGWTAANDVPAGDADPNQTSADVALVEEIMRGSSGLPFDGSRYRFVVAGGPRWTFDRRDEQSIPDDRARAIVAAMVERIPRNPFERASWQSLAERLAEDERGDGIRLVRVTVSSGPLLPEVEESEAVSPSAARAASKTDWIEVKVSYEDGSPFTGNVIIELPDGRQTQGAPDEAGIIRIDGLDPGSCKLSIPELDASAWKQA